MFPNENSAQYGRSYESQTEKPNENVTPKPTTLFIVKRKKFLAFVFGFYPLLPPLVFPSASSFFYYYYTSNDIRNQ